MVYVAAAPSPSRREQRQTIRYEEFLALSDSGVQAEWLAGGTIIFLPPSLRHQHLIIFFAELLQRHCRARALGETLIAPFEMRARPDGPAREPDILFVARQHRDRLRVCESIAFGGKGREVARLGGALRPRSSGFPRA